ncbi:Bifunctional transcriptional activator/DNA repair enzyme Ada [Pontiella desulfatans]|uniref:methylated-DNA--[protein]-cysteine S-methyltransferase n=1 Tax=Pontiella desulfatans TaxID=2750659 RepID=A0A6C2UBZ7_PONDE|nr:methylated-DNA--[protein]-cysteine S-methyltransferase [Pontiella desulfatans]VGO17469.1 Bifunctional transcriptional activator/DNA repair enzyme Ada [Pontiella desulfatans]
MRLHLEAATPAEVKAGGAGWTIAAGYADTPFGNCLLAESPRGICHLSFEEPGAWSSLATHWPNAGFARDDDGATEWCKRIFMEGRRPLPLFVKGTPFQLTVWQALLQIPEGQLISYGRLAERIGNPKASRAVGAAVGQNPIGFLIPCHRVIRETGAIGGYRWGTDRKRAIQAWERARVPAC